VTNPLTPVPDALATELVQAIRRSDALLYVIARPAHDGPYEGGLVVDWGADGMPKRYAALLMRDVAKEWEKQADEAGEAPIPPDVTTLPGDNPAIFDTGSELKG